jgi:hypothetical protein
MARKHEHATRVDQLHADLRKVHRQHQARAGAPPEARLFTVDSEGVVRDNAGRTLYTPPKP